jgi:Malectin domain
LEAVLASAAFTRSPRLARLLSYVCTKFLNGEADQIKEYSIGVEVLQRPPSFDPSTDAGARVEVHRLRRRLQKYYETEGVTRKIRIVIPVGHYVPAFIPNLPSGTTPPTVMVEESPETGSGVPFGLVEDILAREPRPSFRPPKVARTVLIASGLVLLAGAVLVTQLVRRPAPRPISAGKEVASIAPPPRRPAPVVAVLPGNAIRLGCGHTVPYTDRIGQTWAADRYFDGGTPFDSPRQFVARAFDPKLFQSGRMGEFSYHIPLTKGVYQLRLGFVETTYGPATPAGGGEYSRTFDVKANGRPLLTDFDIYSDANGTNVADVRVFKDISPGSDGLLNLEFHSWRAPALINFIELVPAQPHRLNPIRIVAQDNFVTEASGIVWSPDDYVTGGQLAGHAVRVAATEEPDVYIRERFGHFEYALPVDTGTYSLSLHFAEEYFGPGNAGGGGVGSRLFDIVCNGISLARNFDIFKEGGMNRAVVKTFAGLTPNAQGKLVVSFVPVRNYASLYAIELLDESR